MLQAWVSFHSQLIGYMSHCKINKFEKQMAHYIPALVSPALYRYGHLDLGDSSSICRKGAVLRPILEHLVTTDFDIVTPASHLARHLNV